MRSVWTIRANQLTAFERERRLRLAERAVRHLRALDPRAPEETLRAAADGAWEKAKRYGVKSEFEILRLAGLCHSFGVDFDRGRPWVEEILRHPRYSEGTKVRLVWARLFEEAR